MFCQIYFYSMHTNPGLYDYLIHSNGFARNTIKLSLALSGLWSYFLSFFLSDGTGNLYQHKYDQTAPYNITLCICCITSPAHMYNLVVY